MPCQQLRFAGAPGAKLKAAEQPSRFAPGGLRPPPYADASAPAAGAGADFSGRLNNARSCGFVR